MILIFALNGTTAPPLPLVETEETKELKKKRQEEEEVNNTNTNNKAVPRVKGTPKIKHLLKPRNFHR